VDLGTGRTLFAHSLREHQRNTKQLSAYCSGSPQC